MVQRLTPRRGLTALAVSATGVLVLSGLAMASGSGQHDVTRTEDAKATVTEALAVTTSPTRVITSHITIAPGGHTPWHHHPGPHLVAVKSGTLRVYELDCTFQTYTAGQGFIDPGPTDVPHVHTAYNPEGSGPVEVAVTDLRADDLRPTIVADPQPTACFPSATDGVGALGVTRVEDGNATMADPATFTTTGPAEIITGTIVIAPGGHTAWHHHPGPHIVTVRAGTIRVYETDCTFKTFTAGQAFIDPGPTSPPHIHTAWNPDSGNAELLITDVRPDDKRLTVVADPSPAPCADIAAPASGPVTPVVVQGEPAPADVLPKTS